MVKLKTGFLQIFTAPSGRIFAGLIPVLSLLTFVCSWAAVFPSNAVERVYARSIFPEISHVAEDTKVLEVALKFRP